MANWIRGNGINYKWGRILFVICVVVISIFRIATVIHIPFYANANAWCDDRLYVHWACNLLGGNWLGNYNESTLVKGAGYAIYLAALHRLRLPYFATTEILYCISCLLLLLSVKKEIKSDVLFLLSYIILIFNPIMSSADSFQHIYRCALTPIETNILFAGYLGLYSRIDSSIKCRVFFSLCAAIGMATLWFTREDSIWVLPFVLVATVVMIVRMLKSKSNAEMIRGLLVVLLPVIFLLISIGCVKLINKNFYGIAVTTEVAEGAFPNAIKAMYRVEDPCEFDRVSVSREKMKLLYANSETLESVRVLMDADLDGWSMSFGDNGNREVIDAYFYWAIRSTASKAGIYSDAQKANEFYSKIAEEIDDAVASGKLKSRATMPSELMSPWKKGYFEKLINAEILFFKTLYSFNNTETALNMSIDDQNGGLAVIERLINMPAANSYTDNQIQKSCKNIDCLNAIQRTYKMINPIMFFVAVFLLLVLTIKIFLKKNLNYGLWISALSVFLSIVVLSLGISYTHISAYDAMFPSYMAGAYDLMPFFEVLMITNILTVLNRGSR